MSDYVHSDHRNREPAPSRAIESRAMFAVCYLLFLLRAVLYRVMPWRRPQGFGEPARESVFSEASAAASVLVAASFMGL